MNSISAQMNVIEQAIKTAHEAVPPVRPQRYPNQNGRYIEIRIDNKIKKQKLINADGEPTEYGKFYYRTFYNNIIPNKFDNERGLVNGTIRMGNRDLRIIGTRGQVLSKGQEFFRKVKQEYIVEVPHMKSWPGSEVLRPIRDQVNSWYVPLYLPMVNVDMATQNRLGTFLKPLSGPAGIAKQMAEIEEAVIQILRDPDNVEPSKLVDFARSHHYYKNDDGYTVLHRESDVDYVWDDTRPLNIKRKGLSEKIKGQSFTQRILNRPLQNVYYLHGLHHPENYDPSCFEKSEHNCVVNAIHKSYTKIKTKGKHGTKNYRRVIENVMEIEEIEKAFNEIAISHPPIGYDIPYSWREFGITINMLKEFWKSRPNDLNIMIYHKNNKIEEFKIEGYNNGSVSTMVLDVFADHAMFLKNNKQGASQNKLYKNDDEEEYDDEFMPITIPTISKAKPQQYSKWL